MNDVSFLFLFFLGAMTVTRELYPMGFYVVMIAKTNDYKCQTQMKINGLRDAFPVIFNRVKEVELTIVREITKDEYAMAVLGALGMFCGFYLTVFLIPFLVRRDGQNFYDRYYSVNRTLCPIENNPKSFLEGSRIQGSDVFLTISTSSEKNINFSVILYKQPEFRINGFNETIKGKIDQAF